MERDNFQVIDSERQTVAPAQFYAANTSATDASHGATINGALSKRKPGVQVNSSAVEGKREPQLGANGTPSPQILTMSVNHLKRPRPSFANELDLDSEAGSSPKRANSEEPENPASDGEAMSLKGGSSSKKPSNHDPQIDGLLSGPWGVSEQSAVLGPSHSMETSGSNSRGGSEQWSTIREVNAHTPRVGDKYHLIPLKWWASFKLYCHDQGHAPGPISAEDIRDSRGALRKGLVEDEDLVTVSPEVSALLQRWHGFQGPQIFRIVIPSGQKQSRIEFYPPTFTIFLLTPTASSSAHELLAHFNQPLQITLSSKAPFSSLMEGISRHCGVSVSEIRLWRLPAAHEDIMMADDMTGSGELLSDKLKEDGAELIEEAIADGHTLSEALLDSDTRLAIDIKDANGRWTSDDALAKQAADPPLFAPGSDFVTQLSQRASRRTLDSVTGSSITDPSTAPLTIHHILTTNAASAAAPSGGILSAIGSITRSRTGASANPSVKPRGQTGLQNLGNTCFMNSALQCLSHTKELTYYFLSGVWSQELNPKNPLGMSGQVAEAYGKLLNQLWSGQNNAVAPRHFKQVLSRFKDDFAGYRQHDSQELIAFLLDGLHEDLNRILKKPYVEIPDWNGGDDRTVYDFGKQSWDLYRKRNDSIIVDLFQGQYKSTLTCPVCSKVSITFDPFMYLTLPLPINKKWRGQVIFIPKEPSKKGVQVTLQLGGNALIADLCKTVAGFFQVRSTHFIVAEIYASKFYKYFQADERVAEIGEKDIIYLFETPGPAPKLRRSTSRVLRESTEDVGDLIYFPVISSLEGASDCLGVPLIAWGTAEQLSTTSAIYGVIADRYRPYASLKEFTFGPTENMPLLNDGSLADAGMQESASKRAENQTMGDQAPHNESEVESMSSTNAMSKSQFKVYLIPSETSLPLPTAWSLERRRLVELTANVSDVRSTQVRTPPPENVKIDQIPDPSPVALIKQGQGVLVEMPNQMKSALFLNTRNGLSGHYDTFEDPALAQLANRRKKTITLDDCLDEFTREEQLGQSDPWYCPKCKEHRQAYKKFDLWKIPDILVVHLKRFGTARAMRDKIDALVDAPVEGLSLDLRAEEKVLERRFDGSSSDHEALVYDLFAVDNHFGGLGGGHYTAYAKDLETDTWRNYDDSHVSNVSADAVVTSAAYLLFYRRRTNGSLGSVSWEKTVSASNKLKSTQQAEIDAKKSSVHSSSDAGEMTIPGAYSDGSTANTTPLEDEHRVPGYGTWDGGLGDGGHWTEKSTNFTFGLGPGRPPIAGPGTRSPSHQSQTDSVVDEQLSLGQLSATEADRGSGTDNEHASPGLSNSPSSSSSSSSSGMEPYSVLEQSDAATTTHPRLDLFARPTLPVFASHDDGDDEDSHSSLGGKRITRMQGVQHTYGRSHRKSPHTTVFAYPTQADGWVDDNSD